VAGRVHQVEHIGLAVLGLVVEPHGLRLDGDAALALDIHGIEHLLDISRASSPPVSWISRSASVDLPWSIWAMIEKLRIYRYDARGSLMYDSGLIGMRPEHAPLLDDVLAMIDALIGRAKKFPAIEQFALSEVLRLNQIPVAEVRNSFLHYWQGRRRIYTENQIARSLLPDWNDLTLPKQWTEMNGWAVRAYNYYYGTTHALEFLR
jgi:hypothetical protein